MVIYHLTVMKSFIANSVFYNKLVGARSFARLFAPLGVNLKKTTKHVFNNFISLNLFFYKNWWRFKDLSILTFNPLFKPIRGEFLKTMKHVFNEIIFKSLYFKFYKNWCRFKKNPYKLSTPISFF